jgi:hypothetical protein
MAAATEDFQNRIQHFKKMVRSGRTGMLNSIEVQFTHMAQGGDGSAAMEGEIRNTYYPTWSTEDFQSACQAMGWAYKGSYEYEQEAKNSQDS